MNFLQNVELGQTVKNSRLYLSLPCVVGRNGVKKIVEFPFDDAELKGLPASADLLIKITCNDSGGIGCPKFVTRR